MGKTGVISKNLNEYKASALASHDSNSPDTCNFYKFQFCVYIHEVRHYILISDKLFKYPQNKLSCP